MSGLESIALAVAHLEERQKDSNPAILSRNSSDASSSNNPPSLAASSMTAGSINIDTAATATPPRALHVPPTRVISVEEASGVSNNNTMANTNSIAASAASNTSTSTNNTATGNPSRAFGYILADPIKWLQKTQDRPPLQPPTDTVIKVEPTDVLCGRGGETNHHPGNVQYRLLVKAFQPLYVSAKRRDKPLIAQCIVYSVRQVGGRFLKRANDKEWKDVGNTKAREKTSQALREGAPELRGDAGLPKMDKHQQQQQTIMMPSSSTTTAPPPPQPSMPPAPSHHPGGQSMSFAEARFLSALLAQQAALTRSVVTGQHPHHHAHPHHHPAQHGMGHPAMAPAPGGMMPQHHAQEYHQREYQQPAPQQQPLPPVQAQAPPSSSNTNTQEEHNSRKRPAVVSDGQSDSDSIGSNDANSSVPAKKGGPRLKRFKMRLQETKSAA
jgi:hypothetical protein